MRLLMLGWRGPGHPRAGGAEHYTEAVLRRLQARGHRVAWLCEGGSLSDLPVVSTGAAPWLYPLGALYAMRRSAAFDVVIDQINTAGFLAPLWRRHGTLALVHQLAREVWAHEWGAAGRVLGPPLEGAVLAAYRRTPFVTVSQTTLSDLRSIGWRGAGFVAPNGVVPRVAAVRKAARPTLVFLGRFDAAAKRLSHALSMFARVREALPGAAFWVVGRGRPPGPPPAGVRWFPGVTDARRDELLGAAWALVATSVREGWGRMVLEAAAAGTPSIVYRAPGLTEAADALAGTVVAPDPGELAAAAIALLGRPALLCTMGEDAAKRAAAFTWDRTADVWEEAAAAACRRPPIRR